MSNDTSESGCNPSRNTAAEAGIQDGEDNTIVVLGIGNVLWADEGFGVRCVEALQAGWTFADHVQLIDGGTQGLYLIPQVNAARKLIIFDAVDYGLEPGTLKLVENDEVPRFMGAKKMSLHQTGFQEVLMLSQFTGKYPDEVLLIGCQPEELEDFGGSLRPIIKATMARALDLAIERLAAWGAEPKRRDTPLASDDGVTAPMLSIDAYELGRPTAELACRIGDDRFLATEG
ncbi:MAG: HyaD/HybD family hydrogenase maturation endopeptidase [Burkholderiales bacterium]|nr:HyaD/HybD family hydrogenase maturation endopeptidase [Burkholderiales bacterium]